MNKNRHDQHHLLFPAREWNTRIESQMIRQHHSLIPVIPRIIHNEIHSRVPLVPTLGYHALLQVQKIWIPRAETFKSVDSLLLAMDEASRHPRSQPIETALVHLAMQSVEQQRDILREELGQVS